MFPISKCREESNLGLCTTLELAERMPLRNGECRPNLRPIAFFDRKPPLGSSVLFAHRVTCTQVVHRRACPFLQEQQERTATHCNTLHHTATHCSTLQHNPFLARWARKDAAFAPGGVLPHVAACCSVLQRVAACCSALSRPPTLALGSVLQCVAACCSVLQCVAVWCSVMQCDATHCTTLQHTATHCNALQHTATHCNTLQHTTCSVVGDLFKVTVQCTSFKGVFYTIIYFIL